LRKLLPISHETNFNIVIYICSEVASDGVWLPILLSLGAIAALTTVIITNALAQSRILYAMAYDGLLPQVFARLNHNRFTPWVSTITGGRYSINYLMSKYLCFVF
jgi:amino acid transporter